ncbi:MAG: PDZ domain-containing protein [Puniceicoccales bacterium]|jgi:S1-C subfamily serine protease|nr:PDZ domain-containing protein [Puniceicoccales bacterium]
MQISQITRLLPRWLTRGGVRLLFHRPLCALALTGFAFAAAGAPVPAPIFAAGDAVPKPSKTATGADKKPDKKSAARARELKVSPAVRDALVQVELWAQTSEGEDPSASGFLQRCPNCGKFHDDSLATVLEERRPARVAGYLVAPDLVIVSDPAIAGRFTREWRVRKGAESVAATVDAVAQDRLALRLRLKKPLAGAKPLRFAGTGTAAGGKPPVAFATYSATSRGWTFVVAPFDGVQRLYYDTPGDPAAAFVVLPPNAILLDAAGAPVSLTFTEAIAAAGAGAGAPFAPPDRWRWLSAADFAKRAAGLAERLAPALVGVEVRLRPKTVRAGDDSERGSSDGIERELSKPQPAVVLGPRRVLLLGNFDAALTARFESATVRLPDGGRVKARFAGAVRDFGALVLKPERDLAGAVELAAGDAALSPQGSALWWTAALRTRGEKTFIEVAHARLRGAELAWRGAVKAEFGVRSTAGVFVFDAAGALAAIPVSKRDSSGSRRSRWDWGSSSGGAAHYAASRFAVLTDADALSPAKFATWADDSLRPVSEREANQLAWLGVETQHLDKDLAEALGISEQTDTGRHGLLVTQIHPNSPAARGGLKDGDVLLSVRADGEQKETKLDSRDGYDYSRVNFAEMFERYDEVPESYFDRIPPPWSKADNALNTLLKNIGFGHSYTLTYIRKGAVRTAPFKVARGPDYYLTAPEATFEGTGLQVRELTFETRRFYKIPAGQNALIVSRVVSGKTAAIAGIKPYELIVEVNGKPVTTAAEFKKTFDKGGALRLQVRRMDKSRVVTLDTKTATGGKGAKPSVKPPAKPTPKAGPARSRRGGGA